MIKRRGAAASTVLGAIVCLGAVSAAGWSFATGSTPCSLLGTCALACPDSEQKATEEVKLVQVADKATTAETKSCCPLGALAVSKGSVAKTACSSSKSGKSDVLLVGGRFPIVIPASYTAAAGKGECATKTACSSTKVVAVSTTSTDCSVTCTSTGAKVVNAANQADKTECATTCTSSTKVVTVSNTADCGSACTATGAKAAQVSATGGCGMSGAKAIANKADCAKACAGSAKVVNAASTGCASQGKVCVLGSVSPIVMPAVFCNSAGEGFCVKSCEPVGCGGEKASCTSAAAVVPGGNTTAGKSACCTAEEAKSCCKSASGASDE